MVFASHFQLLFYLGNQPVMSLRRTRGQTRKRAIQLSRRFVPILESLGSSVLPAAGFCLVHVTILFERCQQPHLGDAAMLSDCFATEFSDSNGDDSFAVASRESKVFWMPETLSKFQ